MFQASVKTRSAGIGDVFHADSNIAQSHLRAICLSHNWVLNYLALLVL